MKSFIFRISVLLPLAVFSNFILFILIGILANTFGAQDAFYCTMYCKLGLSLLISTIIAIFICQANYCFQK